jgi:hypothetical protein
MGVMNGVLESYIMGLNRMGIFWCRNIDDCCWGGFCLVGGDLWIGFDNI